MTQPLPKPTGEWPLQRLALISAIAAIAFVVVGVALSPALASVAFEITLQFLLIVVFGGVLSRIYQDRELARLEGIRVLEQEKHHRDNQLHGLQEAHSELLESYNEAKRIRRLLRGSAVLGTVHDEHAKIDLPAYREHMEALIDVQLNLEALKRRAKGGLWSQLTVSPRTSRRWKSTSASSYRSMRIYLLTIQAQLP